MKYPPVSPRLALGMLALSLLVAPLSSRAADGPKEKPAEALKKYDANGNGKLDEDEMARKKADDDDAKAVNGKTDRAARRAEAAEKKVDIRTQKNIDRAIRKSNKARKVR